MGNCIPLSRLILHCLILLFILFRFSFLQSVPLTENINFRTDGFKVKSVWDSLRLSLRFEGVFSIHVELISFKISCGHWVNCSGGNWFIVTALRNLFIDRQIEVLSEAFKLLAELNLSLEADCIMKIQSRSVLFAQSISVKNKSINVVKSLFEG